MEGIPLHVDFHNVARFSAYHDGTVFIHTENRQSMKPRKARRILRALQLVIEEAEQVEKDNGHG